MEKKKLTKGCNFGYNKKCPHGKFEFVEADKKKKIIWARCYYCFALFKFPEKDFLKQNARTKTKKRKA